MGNYGGSSEHSSDQSHCSANFSGGFQPVGSNITEMTHRERKARLMVCRGRGSIEVVGVAGEQYDVGEFHILEVDFALFFDKKNMSS